MPVEAVRPATDVISRDVLRQLTGLDWPRPGSGETMRRWRLLAELARRDLPLAKLVEPHHDAVAILHDLGAGAPQRGSVWGVWAAEPPFARLVARPDGRRWRLTGRKAFCSGASVVTNAAVTADTSAGTRLFAIDLDEPGITVDDTAPVWTGQGMRRADTRSLTLDDVAADAMGDIGDYVQRPGFWHGAIGIAACWHGGTQGVADTLERDHGRLDDHGRAHLGAVRADLDAMEAMLGHAARVIDAGDADRLEEAERLALSARALAADVAERVVSRVGRALGPGPLAFDEHHADHVADIQVFVRQHHAERDLARLGSIGRRDD